MSARNVSPLTFAFSIDHDAYLIGAFFARNICGILVTVTVFVGCLPNFLAIRDIQLKVSIALFFSGIILGSVTSCLAWNALTHGNLDDFGRWNIAGVLVWVAAFVAQSFYSLRRTCMIYTASPRAQLWVPIFMCIVQCAIQYTNSTYWSIDMLNSYGTKVSRETAQINIVTIVWFLVTEPTSFALLQYKIVQSSRRFQRDNKDRLLKIIALWVEAAMRLAMYLVTVLFCYLATADYLKPNKLAWWSMVVVLPASIGLIFLTDVARFQKALRKTADEANNNSNAPSIRSEFIQSASEKPATTPRRPDSSW
ncbi:hypothetical protein HK104_002758 [Borealophlyctis nickersoniae]|nr:hypothetical protein HK104_002758 [Borealophlyctis nickersoniae]